MDLKFSVSEKNKLWARWKRVSRTGDGRVSLHDMEFYGPVTQDYFPLEEKGNLRLDFTNHFLFRIEEYYIVQLSWEGIVSQEQGLVKFKKVTLDDQSVGLLDKIKDNDLLLIDCSGHTDKDRSSGNYRLVYHSMLYDETGAPYDFSKK